MDLIIINSAGTVITSFFLALYLYVKIKVNHHQHPLLFFLLSLPAVYLAFSAHLSSDRTGLMATSLSIMTQITCLDSVSQTLKTRDSATVNMGITIASIINGLVWMTYAILVKDVYVLLPNVAAIASASVQLNLYQWTQGKLENNHWFIKLLQKKFNMKGNKALGVMD